jgi:hypothetical protein
MRRLRLAVALCGAVAWALLCAGALTMSGGPAGADSSGGTPLPAGWELCVLQGVAAPATAANVADLDAWQAAEGGSTNNSAAYNPFNTRRTTDVNNKPIPNTASSNGFPAFATWLGGCAATVGTLSQPNMGVITAALRAGDVSPPGAFLASVDQSQWCAPSANGTPCYTNQIVGASGSLASTLISDSSALTVYGNVNADLHAYEQDLTTTATDKGVLTTRDDELFSAALDLSATQQKLAAAEHALQRFAIDAYVNGGTYAITSFMNLAGPRPFGAQDANGVVASQYENIVASELEARDQSDQAAERAALSRKDAATQARALATATLASDNAAETHALNKLVDAVATLQNAGACTTAVITVAAPATPGAGSAVGAGTSGTSSQSGTDSPTTTTSTTTTSTTVPASRTTTTTVPPSSTTTSTIPTTVPAVKVPVTVPTTVPPSTTTTTTTAPPTSTTTTTIAGEGPTAPATATPQTPNPAGIQVLQGCVTSLAPTPGQ